MRKEIKLWSSGPFVLITRYNGHQEYYNGNIPSLHSSPDSDLSSDFIYRRASPAGGGEYQIDLQLNWAPQSVRRVVTFLSVKLTGEEEAGFMIIQP